MSEQNTSSEPRQSFSKANLVDMTAQESIDFGLLFKQLWLGKWYVVAFTVLFSIASVGLALYLPNIYRSDVVLSPVSDEQQGGLAALAGQFGGLASLAGIDLSGDGSEKSAIALEVIVSRDFITNFIEKHDLLVPLMAADGWLYETRELKYDDSIYSVDDQKWVREVSPPFTPKPSMQEAYEAFMESFTVTTRSDSNMVVLGFEHYSPDLAKQWLDWMVLDINTHMKFRDQHEAQRSIDYLQKQLEATNIAELQSLLFELIEEQTKTLMFTQIRDEYIFETIDPAIVAQEKFKPKRAVIAIIGFLLGGFIGCAFVLIRNALANK